MVVRLMQSEASLYKFESGKQMPVKSAVTLLYNILHQNRYYPLYVGMVIGGLDDKPRLFEIGADGSVIEQKYVSVGSGEMFAFGYLENNYKENKTVKENTKLAVKAVATAMKRDLFTGDGIMLVSITKSGYKEYSKEEIDALLAEKEKE